MNSYIEYGRAGIASQASANGALLLAGSEITIMTVTDPKYLDKSQLTLYIDQVLGAASKVAYGVYFSFDGGVTYYKISVEDLTTNKGDLVDIPPYVDANTPLQSSTHLKTFMPVPIPAATAMKITAIATGGTAGAYIVTAVVRNN